MRFPHPRGAKECEKGSRSRNEGTAVFPRLRRGVRREGGRASRTAQCRCRHSRVCRSNRNPPIAACLLNSPARFVRVRPSWHSRGELVESVHSLPYVLSVTPV